MANTLGLYDPLFYAQEALSQLEKALGMAGRVHRGYEPTPQQQGSTIQIRRPTSFTATDMPHNSNASDISPDTISLVLNQWKGVSIKLTDKELAYTKEQVIQEHIRPMAVAVADAIDLSLVGMYTSVPWVIAASGTIPNDFTASWQRLFDNKVPMDDLHYMINGERTATYLGSSAFSQWQGAGDAGVNTQQRGTLGTKFGFETFSNQNVALHTGSTALASVTQLQLNANAAKGASTIVVKDSDGVLSGTLVAGDHLIIAGDTQRYAITANSTAAANLFTLSISPALVKAYSTNDNVTLTQTTNAKYMNLAFKRQAFAIGMAPLSDLGNQVGARIETVVDPITNLALRSRLFYDGKAAEVWVSIDALWGVTVLNPNMAVRVES